MKRIAYVEGGSEHDPQEARFAETVARNRGVNVRLFWAVEDAEIWLCELAAEEKRAVFA